MTLTELRYLVAVADHQHFGRAAAGFGVSQPSLSMAIRHLEDELGVLLFERSKSGTRVTDAGREIIEQARRVMAQADHITALVQADKDQLGGEFKLGAIHSLGPYLLPQLIPQLRLIANGLRLSVYEGVTADLSQKLRVGELDGVLIAGTCAEVDVVTQELYREPLVAVMPAKHPLAAKSQISQADLAGQTFILLQPGHCLRDQILGWFPGLLQGETLECTSIETLRHMIAIGLGVSILPSSAAMSSVYASNSLRARPLEYAPTRSLALAWRASFPRHKAVDAVRRAIQICSWQFTTANDAAASGLLVENQSW